MTDDTKEEIQEFLDYIVNIDYNTNRYYDINAVIAYFLGKFSSNPRL